MIGESSMRPCGARVEEGEYLHVEAIQGCDKVVI